MSSGTGPERQGPIIVSALQSAVSAFEAGDTEAAARALEVVSTACAQAGAQHEQLTREELATASDLYARCQREASQVGDGLVASLLESAKLRTASNAYKSRP